MKKIYIVLMSVLLSTLSFGQSKSEKIDEFLNLLNDNNQFMGVVSIYESGALKYSHSVGFLDTENGTSLNTETKFRIGSISKMYTSVLVFKAIESGKLKLDTKLSKYFPQIKNARQITISQLLQHQSGIPNFTNSQVYLSKMYTGMTEDEVIDLILSMPVELEPGTAFSYSNSNFYLLSLILEKVTKKSFSSLLKEQITQPLDLENTYYGQKTRPEQNEAYSFAIDGTTGNWQKSGETEMSIPKGAGAIVSNQSDLNAFIQALFEGKLVSQNSLEQMMSLKEGFGYGMMVLPFYERQAYGHLGSIDGFESCLVYFPEDKISLVILANAVGSYSFNDVGLGVLSFWFDKDFDLPNFSQKPVTLSQAELKAFEGTFSNSTLGLNIKLWEQDGALMAQADGQSGFALESFEGDVFKFAPAGIIMEFNQERTEFTLIQGGGRYIFKKN